MLEGVLGLVRRLGDPLGQHAGLAAAARRPLGQWTGAHLLVEVSHFELMILTYLDQMYSEGTPAAQGDELFASVCFFFPGLNEGVTVGLPRISRALCGRGKAVPAQSRLPLPWVALMSIVEPLIVHQ